MLTHQLGRHPDIAITDPKEPHFLALAGTEPRFTGPGDDVTINRRAVVDPERWRALFADLSGSCRGEGSVSTLYYGGSSIPNILRYCPDVRLVVVLRDPVDRAWSAHQYLSARGHEREPFERALDLEGERRRAGWHHLWHYVAMSRYAEQLRPFIETFGAERILVLDYDALVAEPSRTLGRCFRFLGVAPQPVEGATRPVNASGAPRSATLATWAERARGQEHVRALVRRAVPFSVRERMRSLNVQREDMPEGARRRLDELLADERETLARLVGVDAPAWTRHAA